MSDLFVRLDFVMQADSALLSPAIAAFCMPHQVAIVGCVSWFRHDQQNWLLWRICRKCDYKYRILKLMQQNKFCTSFLSVRILNTLTILWPIRWWSKAVDGSVRSVSRIDSSYWQCCVYLFRYIDLVVLRKDIKEMPWFLTKLCDGKLNLTI